MTTKKKVVIGCVIGYLVLAVFLIQFAAGALYYCTNKSWPHDISLGTWANYWNFYADNATQRGRLQFAMATAIFLVVGMPLLIANALMQKTRSLHGDARFATTAEIRKDGLLGSEGVIIGKLGNEYVMIPGTAPILLAAPTRQGKGAGVVIPNLLNYPDSVVVLDIKLENYQLTSKFRAKYGQKVFLFNPFDEEGRTHRWNPMDAIRRDPNLRVVDAMAIGEMLYPRSNDDSGMWNDLARDLFMGFALYLLETPELPCTFGEILRQISGKGRGIKEHVQHIIEQRLRGDDALSDPCYQAFSRFCSAQERTLSSIVTTATAPLLIFQNAYVDAATSATDFDVSRVRKERMSIYVGIPAPMMSTASLIVNLFFSHLLNQNMRELPEQNPELKYQCLVLMDEFTTLGRVGIIAKSIGQIAGFNMRLLLVIQGISQLIAAYGEQDARTIEDMCVVQLLYPPRAQKDANEYSEMLGAFTAKSTSTGISRPRALGSNNGSASENVSDQRRSLMLPQELRELAWESEIIIKQGIKPILCHKAFYFTDAVFVSRLKAVSPILARIKGMPSEKQMKEAALTLGDLSTQVPRHDVDLHMAKVEKRERVIGAGENVEVAALSIDETKIPHLAPGEEPSDEAIAELTLGMIQGFEGCRNAPGVDDGIPMVEEEAPMDLAGLEAAAARLPAATALVDKMRAPVPIAGRPRLPTKRKRSRIDLDALKKGRPMKGGPGHDPGVSANG
jgi:type IV secretion system protein VirD4